MEEDLPSSPKQESLIPGNSCMHTYGVQSQKRKHGNPPESFLSYNSQDSALGIHDQKSNQNFYNFESVDMSVLNTNVNACLVSSSDVDYLHNLENTPEDMNINPIITDSILSNFQCDNVISERDKKSMNIVFDNQSTDIFTEQVIGQSNFSKTIGNCDRNENASGETINNNESLFSDITYNEITQEDRHFQRCSLSDQNQAASINITDTYPSEIIQSKLDTFSYNGNLSKRMKNIEIQISPVRIRIAATLGEDSVEHVDQSMEIEVDSDPNDSEDTTDEQEANDIEEDNHENIEHAVGSGGPVVGSVENMVSAEIIEPLSETETGATTDETRATFPDETKIAFGRESQVVPIDEILTEKKEKILLSESKDTVFHENQNVSDSFSHRADLNKEERSTEVADQDIDEGVDVSDELDVDDQENLNETKIDSEVLHESEDRENGQELEEKIVKTSEEDSSDVENEKNKTVQDNEVDEKENGYEMEEDDNNSLIAVSNDEETEMKETEQIVGEDVESTKNEHKECSEKMLDDIIETDTKEDSEKNVETDIDKCISEEIEAKISENKETSEKTALNDSAGTDSRMEDAEPYVNSEVKKNEAETLMAKEVEEQATSNLGENVQAACTKDDPTELEASEENIDDGTGNVEKRQEIETEKGENELDASNEVINEDGELSVLDSEKHTEIGLEDVHILNLQTECGETQNLENTDDLTKLEIEENPLSSNDMGNADQISHEKLESTDDEVQLEENKYINEEKDENNEKTEICDEGKTLAAKIVTEDDAVDVKKSVSEIVDSNIEIGSPKSEEAEVLESSLQTNLNHEKTESEDLEAYCKTSDIDSHIIDDSLDMVEGKEIQEKNMEDKVNTIDENVTEESTTSVVGKREDLNSSDKEINDNVAIESCKEDTDVSENNAEEEANETCVESIDQGEEKTEEDELHSEHFSIETIIESQELVSDVAEKECASPESNDHDIKIDSLKGDSETTVIKSHDSCDNNFKAVEKEEDLKPEDICRTGNVDKISNNINEEEKVAGYEEINDIQDGQTVLETEIMIFNRDVGENIQHEHDMQCESQTNVSDDVKNDENELVCLKEDNFDSMSVSELKEKFKDEIETSVDEEEVNLETCDEVNLETCDELNPKNVEEEQKTEAVDELNLEVNKLNEEINPEAVEEPSSKVVDEEMNLEVVDEKLNPDANEEDEENIIHGSEENYTGLEQILKENAELIPENAKQSDKYDVDAEVENTECLDGSSKNEKSIMENIIEETSKTAENDDSKSQDGETGGEKNTQNEILSSSEDIIKIENYNEVHVKPLQKAIAPELISLLIKSDLDSVEKSVIPDEKSSQQVTTDSSKVISPRKGIKVEEDEIETAISTVQFYDESSDANEGEFISSKVSNSEQKHVLLKDTDIVKPEGDEHCDHESTKEEMKEADPDANTKEMPLQLPSEVDGTKEKAPSEAAKAPTVSPKKRKRKRKVARSRSAPQKSSHQDGVSSAAKKTQESRTSGSKGTQPDKTARSLSSSASRSSSAVEKKIPPIKAPVGNAPPPKIKAAKSKIGSLDNVTHKPKGGEKKVESVKLEWNAKPKVGSLDYATHKPGGGDKKILTQKVDFKNVQSKVGSKDNLKHKPGGGAVKVATEKLDFKDKAKPKVGSLDNSKHKAGGGNVSIKSEKLNFKEKAASKIHSRSESEKGSSHGGSETQSPVLPSSPAPPEGMPPLCEDDSPCSQEGQKQADVTCNGGTGDKGAAISQEASPVVSPDKGGTEVKRDESNLQGNETVNGTGTQPDC